MHPVSTYGKCIYEINIGQYWCVKLPHTLYFILNHIIVFSSAKAMYNKRHGLIH